MKGIGKTGPLTLALIGETNVQGRVKPAEAFRDVVTLLEKADVIFGHLEAPLTNPSADPAVPDIPHKTGWKHSDHGMVKAFTEAGFDAVSLASNVMYGRKAVIDTVETLDGAGIGHCGAGRNRADAAKPAIVVKGGIRFGFLSYTSVFWPVGHAAGLDTPGIATVKIHTSYEPGRRALEMPGADPIIVTRADEAELEAMRQDIRNLRALADVLIVSIHWGISGSDQTIDYQREVGKAAIEAGADVVMGHHPHRIQGVEFHNGKPILYSMGNFAFDWYKMQGRNLDGIVALCRIIDRQMDGIHVVPVRRMEGNTVAPVDPDGQEGQEIVDRLAALSEPFGTRLERSGGEIRLIPGSVSIAAPGRS